MAYWLLKTEPEEFSWDDQVKRGAKGEAWTGVRNFIARGNLKAMKKGEHAFFYHTGEEKQVVGVVEVIREAYKDPTDEKGVFLAVDVEAVKPFPGSALAAVKAAPENVTPAVTRAATARRVAMARNLTSESPEPWLPCACRGGNLRTLRKRLGVPAAR